MTRQVTAFRWFLLSLPLMLLMSGQLQAAKPVVDIQGADAALEKNLRDALPLTAEPCEAPSWRIRQLFNRSDPLLEKSARALGYYHFETEKKLTFKDDCWQALFTVTPGKPVKLANVSIEIHGQLDPDADFAPVREQTLLQVGEQLHHGNYEKTKQQITAYALEKGYLDGRFLKSELQVDPQQHRAFVVLHFDAGQRYRLGSLRLQQQAYTPKLLQRYITIQQGDYYDAKRLAQLHRNLADSGFFDRVNVKQDFVNAIDGEIDVLVELEPRKATAYTIGIGAATDTGPRVSASYEKRRVNRYGHRFNTELLLSEVEQALGFGYDIPVHYPHLEQISLRTSFEQIDTETTNSDINRLGLKTLGERHGWVESWSLEWVSENSEVDGEEVDARLLVPGVSWVKTKADDRLHPRQGYRANLALRGADKALLSDVSFLQLLIEGKWIQPLGRGRLLLRGETGLSLVDDFDQVPASYRFYAGGDQSVRGYAYRSLSPEDADGDRNGGQYLLTGSIEYDHPVIEDWSAAMFWDVGNAFDSWDVDLKQSVGVGVRWHSPVGMIRLDAAVPNDNAEDDFRLHFSMGLDL